MRVPLATTIAALLLLAPAAAAATEAGDAGDLPANAQDLSADAVSQIDGALAGTTDVDVYRLCLPGGGTFSASTVGGTDVDTQLFLFDADGLGVYGNDDDGVSRQSTLPAEHALTPRAAGEYLLAVAPYNRDPLSAGGPIFPALGSVLAPTGLGASQPVSEWSGRVSGDGPYRVRVTGAGCTPPDTTPPAIDLRAPLDGGVYLLDEDVAADYGCQDEPVGSRVASCTGTVADGAPIDTGTVGEKTFRVEAADTAGNTSAAQAVYHVAYDFGGFLWPVENPPHVNRRIAGATVPIRFELGGHRGPNPVADGWPQVAEVECGAGEEPPGGEPARHVRWFGELAFRKRKGRYVYLWRTEREWAGSCREFILKLDDRTVRRADFEFVRRARGPWRSTNTD